MAKITIDKEKCKGCFLCVTFCHKGLIKVNKRLNKRGVNYVEFSRHSGIPRQGGGKDNDGCSGCMMCAIICPDCCIEVWK